MVNPSQINVINQVNRGLKNLGYPQLMRKIEIAKTDTAKQ